MILFHCFLCTCKTFCSSALTARKSDGKNEELFPTVFCPLQNQIDDVLTEIVDDAFKVCLYLNTGAINIIDALSTLA